MNIQWNHRVGGSDPGRWNGRFCSAEFVYLSLTIMKWVPKHKVRLNDISQILSKLWQFDVAEAVGKNNDLIQSAHEDDSVVEFNTTKSGQQIGSVTKCFVTPIAVSMVLHATELPWTWCTGFRPPPPDTNAPIFPQSKQPQFLIWALTATNEEGWSVLLSSVCTLVIMWRGPQLCIYRSNCDIFYAFAQLLTSCNEIISLRLKKCNKIHMKRNRWDIFWRRFKLSQTNTERNCSVDNVLWIHQITTPPLTTSPNNSHNSLQNNIRLSR